MVNTPPTQNRAPAIERFRLKIDLAQIKLSAFKEKVDRCQTDQAYREIARMLEHAENLLLEIPREERAGLLEELGRISNDLTSIEDKRKSRRPEVKLINPRPLPPMEMSKFNGKASEWPTFWAQASQVALNRNDLSDEEKYVFLWSWLGPAVSPTIAHLSAEKPQLSKLISALKEAYATEELNFDDLSSQIAKLPLLNLRSEVSTLVQYVQLVGGLRRQEEEQKMPDIIKGRLLDELGRRIDPHERRWITQSCEKDSFMEITFRGLHTHLSKLLKAARLDNSLLQSKPSYTKSKTTFQTPRHRSEQTQVKVFAQNTNRPVQRCVFDDGVHLHKDCPLSYNQRFGAIMNLNLCHTCLKPDVRGHKCVRKPCGECGPESSHHYLLCRHRGQKRAHREEESESEVTSLQQGEEPPKISSRVVIPAGSSLNISSTMETSVSNISSPILPLSRQLSCSLEGFVPTCPVLATHRHKTIKICAFLDSGSTHTLISLNLAKRLELPLFALPVSGLRVDTLAGPSTSLIKYRTQLTFKSLSSSFTTSWVVLVSIRMPVIYIPEAETLIATTSLEDVHVCAPGLTSPDLIIGQTHELEILLFSSARHIKLKSDILLSETRLGWFLYGRRISQTGPLGSYSTRVEQQQDCICTIMRQLFPDFQQSVSSDRLQEQYIERMVQAIRFEPTERRCYVRFTWLSEERPPNNFRTVRAICWRTYLRFDQSMRQLYLNELDTYVREGYARRLPGNATDGYFIPHRPILKEGSTTAVRPVFNASFARKNELSLNDLLFQGGWDQTLLIDCILRWRAHQWTIFADIQKAFLQIKLEPEDRKFVRFVWFRENRMELFEMTSVLFGATASPFLLYIVLKKLFREFAPDDLHDFVDYIYMDDALIFAESADELRWRLAQVRKTLALASFSLHKLAMSSQTRAAIEESSKSEIETKVLGVHWLLVPDVISWPSILTREQLTGIRTRRELASIFARIFDPVGLLTPYVIRCRAVIRDSFISDDWDSPLPEHVQKEAAKLLNELAFLDQVTFPRICSPALHDGWIDVYSDASSMAYGACAYLVHQPSWSSRLLQAKGRLTAKDSERTMPELELCGAVIGAQMGHHLHQLFKLPIRYFTDSECTRHWISNGPQGLRAFVAHRVNLIRKLTSPENWHYIRSAYNPADMVSRGASLQDLSSSTKWRSPDPPMLTSLQCHSVRFSPEPLPSPQDTLTRLLSLSYPRLKALIEFFLETFEKRYGYVRRVDRQQGIGRLAFITLWRLVQSVSLGPFRLEEDKVLLIEVPSYLKNLCLTSDEFGLVRLKRRISEADVPFAQKYPLVIPDHPIVPSFLKYLHETSMLHAPLSTMLKRVSQFYFLPYDTQRLKPIIDKCLRCNRYKDRSPSTITASLPADRVTGSRAFEVVGIDLFGQLRPTSRKRRRSTKTIRPAPFVDLDAFYVLIFSCACSRAIHLEPVASKSTSSILKALTRFSSIYGVPRKFYSDNEKSFHQMAKWLRSIRPNFEQAIRQYTKMFPIEWQFSPPMSPWYGGFWERMIGTVKKALRAYQPARFGTFEDLSTVLAEVQAFINSRPLVQLPGEPDYLTPFHLLLGRNAQPMALQLASNLPPSSDLLSLQRTHDRLLNLLWRKWRDLYLSSLRACHKEQARALRVGELVLLRDPSRYRAFWPLALVKTLIPSPDGQVRRVEIEYLNKKTAVVTIPRLISLEDQGPPAPPREDVAE